MIAAVLIAAEISRPLPVVTGQPISVTKAAAPLGTSILSGLPAKATFIGNNGNFAYFFSGKRVVAVDLYGGRTLWQTLPKYEGPSVEERTAVTPHVVYVQGIGGVIGLSARDGHESVSFPAFVSSYIDGTLYYTHGESDEFSAADPKTGKPLWSSGGGALGIIGPAFAEGSTVMQPFQDSSGKSVDVIYAFDKHSGRQLWWLEAESDPLGFGRGTVYLNTMVWPNPDSYEPLAIGTVNVTTGKILHEYVYAPDPARNAASYDISANVPARVDGRYVYLQVGGTWYRYLADRPPADPFRMDGLEFKAWLGENRLLVTDATDAYLGRMWPNKLELSVLGDELHSPVVRRSDGAQYAVIDGSLLRFDRTGGVRVVGHVPCTTTGAIAFWPQRVAVICADGTPSAAIFTDDFPLDR